MIDLHAHVLIGVDDGPAGEAEALELLEQFVADGVHTVVATPHTLDGRYDVPPQAVQEGVEHVNALARGCHLPLRVLPGHEIAVGPEVPARLEEGELLCLGGDTRVVLLEMGFQVVPAGLAELVFRLTLAGYGVLLAHPERNLEVQRRPDVLAGVVAAGGMLQLNAGSVSGASGRRVRETASALLRRGWVEVVASDAHHVRHRPCLMGAARERLHRWLGEEKAEQLLCRRPAELLEPAQGSRTRRG